VTPVAPTHHEAFGHRAPKPRHNTAPAPSLPTGPPAGTFTINAPVLGAVGTAAVRTDTVELTPTGEWANTSSFIAPTAAGEFSINQVVRRSTVGVVSANLQPAVPTAATATTTSGSQLQSSHVTTTPTDDGNVLVNVSLKVATPASAGQQTTSTPSLSIAVHAVYTPDITTVLAEQVTVVEGSAPCCDSPANTTPLSSPGGGGGSTSPPPAALGSAAVSPLSPTRRDDQTTTSSS
jgi:hypothetical protein